MKNLPKILIAGSRELSSKRILSLFKRYSQKYSIIWGVYLEPYILEFEDQPHFRTLKKDRLEKFKELLSSKDPKLAQNLEILEYSQKEETELISEINPSKIIFINGSWKIVFHRRPLYEVLKKLQIPYSLKSPFIDEEEAKQYSKKVSNEINDLIDSEFSKKLSVDKDLIKLADIVAKRSFDYTWQTGAVLVKDSKVLLTGHNRILPYETYAMHNGSIREKNKAGLNDLNHYDTMHGEMDIVTQALKKGISLDGTILYVNLMPCPNCARVLAASGLKKLVCRHRHYGDFTEQLFESMGIEVVVTESTHDLG